MERCGEAERCGNTCCIVPWSFFDVPRGYCDTCIIKGELLAQKQGLDTGVNHWDASFEVR